MGTQNTQDHVQTLTCTRALLPDVSYRLALCTHEQKNAPRGRAPHCSHWRPHTRWQNCGAGAGDVLSRRQHGHSHRTARPRSCARSSSTHSARTDRHERARAERRTGEGGDEAPPKTRFLVGLARPLRAVLRVAVRPEIENGLRTRFERPANVSMTSEGMLAEFEALHRPSWKSRCQHHQSRPEMLQTITIAHTLIRAAT